MIYVFLGEDFNILNKKVNELVNKLNIENIIKYDFNESSISEIINESNYVDLFNEKKLIIVSSFSFKKLKSNNEEELVKYINNMNDNIIIFKCTNESLDERKNLTKLLREKCKVIECAKLDYKSLHEYVTNMFKENNLNISYNQVKTILDKCEYNPDYTISEVEKLIIYKMGEKDIFDEDIENLINESIDKEIFRFTDFYLKKDVSSTLNSYKKLKVNTDEVILVDMLAKQIRLLLQLKQLKGKYNDTEISKKLGANPYTLKKLYPYLNDYSYEDLKKRLYKLSDIDYNIKVLGYDKSKELEYFLIEV